MSDDHRRAEFNAKVVEFTRQLRNEAEVWPIFERVGFREYFSMEEIRFLHRRIPQIAPRQAADRPIKSLDWMISFGLLGRLADGLIVDSDLDGKWVSGFIIDRWHVPSVERNGLRQSGGWRPVELGWVMALAREIAKDPACWDYFSALTEFQHNNPRERPIPNPIDDLRSKFRNKYCLWNREPSLGIYRLLYGKLQGKIEDIKDAEEVAQFLLPHHSEKPSPVAGINVNSYFEVFDR